MGEATAAAVPHAVCSSILATMYVAKLTAATTYTSGPVSHRVQPSFLRTSYVLRCTMHIHCMYKVASFVALEAGIES